MNAETLRPWIEVVSLHPDVLAENFSEDIFALDFGPLADGNSNVPAVYRDAEHFFRVSYITRGLWSLLEDVLSRLAGGSGNRVLKLVTPLGGGKSHTLAALWHAARKREALNVIPEAAGLPQPGNVRTAAFDGQFFDATNGKQIPDTEFRARTIWGWIAWSLGRDKGFDLLRPQDEARVAPGADEILRLLAEGPNLILLDEVLNYLISAGGVKIHQTTLRDETILFLQRLTVAVENTKNTALVFSLQSSKRESLEYIGLLQTVDQLAKRKDQLREPVEGDEILSVIQRRLLAKLPGPAESSPASTTYQQSILGLKRALAQTASEREQAEEEAIALRDRIRAAYPFHPALIDLMSQRWRAMPDFQQTRGALRFLAACLRATNREGRSRPLLGPGDVPMHDSEVRLAFFKEVGQQSDFQAVLDHDFIGAGARARRIDEWRARENPAETGKRPAMRLATAILMYSFGGLRREGGKEGDFLPPGISESELLAVCVGPDFDTTTAQACLKELREQCLYLHFDGVRYCFKKDPNVTLLVEQESDAVARSDRLVREKIKEMLEARLAEHRHVIVWPEKSGEVDDREPAFLTAYLPLEFAAKPRATQQATAKDIFENYGDRKRHYKNGVGLALPFPDQVEALRRSVRYMLAIERVKEKARQHNLTDEQRSQLREFESTRKAEVESAFQKLYAEVWLPKVEGGSLEIESVAIGGRPLQTTLNAKKEAEVHGRIMELLTVVQRKVFGDLKPAKIVELFNLADGTPSVRTADVVDGFFSFPGFPRLLSDAVIRKAVARGIQDGVFGYTAGQPPKLGANARYEIAPDKVRFGRFVGEDEIDLDSGFLMLPQAIPQPAPTAPAGQPVSLPAGSGAAPGSVLPGSAAAVPAPAIGVPQGTAPPRKLVELSFVADRDKLYQAWEALANLAEMAGTVSLTVRAESVDGFDRSKLENGVIEPLKEADLIE